MASSAFVVALPVSCNRGRVSSAAGSGVLTSSQRASSSSRACTSGNTFLRPSSSFESKQNRAAFFGRNVPTVDSPVLRPIVLNIVSELERTFVAVKPDGVQRGVVGDIIRRFENKGYKLIGLKALVPSKELAEKHYEALSSKPFFPSLVEFIISGPVVGMVWEGKGVVAMARKMIGATNPLASEPGSIRGDFGVDVGRNVIHGSDSVENAEREIALWFKPEEVLSWTATVNPWIYE